MALADSGLRLCTTRISGHVSHLGFTDMFLGRLEGINQAGLCVSLSIAWDLIPEDWQEPGGLHYAVALRAALEQCRNLDEALDLWQRMPIGNNGTFLAADPSGSATCIEIAGCKRAVKRIGADTDEQYLVSTNHFTLLTFPDPEKHVPIKPTVKCAPAAAHQSQTSQRGLAKERLHVYGSKHGLESIAGQFRLRE